MVPTWLGDVEPADLGSTFYEFAGELVDHFSPAINVERARLYLMSSFFPSRISLKISIPNTSCRLFFKRESPKVERERFRFARSCPQA